LGLFFIVFTYVFGSAVADYHRIPATIDELEDVRGVISQIELITTEHHSKGGGVTYTNCVDVHLAEITDWFDYCDTDPGYTQLSDRLQPNQQVELWVASPKWWYGSSR
jgi:hypothetical protein